MFTVLHTQLPNKQRAEFFCTTTSDTVGFQSWSPSPGTKATVPSLTLIDCIQQIQQLMIQECKGFQADRYCLAFSRVLLPEKVGADFQSASRERNNFRHW